MLGRYSQLWYVSGDAPTLSAQQVQMIVKYVGAGNGLAIWADNAPFFADANLLAQALIGTTFSGDTLGDKVMISRRPAAAGPLHRAPADAGGEQPLRGDHDLHHRIRSRSHPPGPESRRPVVPGLF